MLDMGWAELVMCWSGVTIGWPGRRLSLSWTGLPRDWPGLSMGFARHGLC
jgi:hypothetical protein